jgi:hypothetical protein
VRFRISPYATLYVTSALVTALLLSWLLLAQANFLYGFWHDHVGIAEGIEEYGPQNRYRQGFADTTRAERVRLFAAINEAIHNEGEGLADIRYHSATLAQPQPLLREPEIWHLQDVANLVQVLGWVSAIMALVWLICLALAVLRSYRLPSLKHQLIGILAGIGIVGAIVLAIGPVAVFNQLHIWIFPADHPWFFYYQDSLMSTMMMAPSLFGWIVIAWVPLAIACFLLLHAVATGARKLAGGERAVPRQ